MTLYRPIPFVHQLLKEHIRKESYVIDATCGHGHDSLYIASLLGSNGKLFCFDIQEEAIINTKHRLSKTTVPIFYYQTSHTEINKELSAYHHKIDVVIFNLGFLPHTDEQLTTNTSTTLKALQAAYDILRHKGLLIVVTYPGHIEGAKENETIATICQQISDDVSYITCYQKINLASTSPIVYAIEKRSLEKNPFKPKTI